MVEQVDLESEQFQTLLGDALRSGPGSPEWHQAVRLLRARGSSGEDYRLLVAAREHLESGKGYRAVRAGPGFTRRVMDGLREEAGGRERGGGPRSAGAVLWLSAAVIVAVAAVVMFLLLRGGGPRPTPVDELDKTFFTRPLLPPAKFDSPAGPEGKDWARFGTLPLEARNGLRLAAAAAAGMPAASPATVTSAAASAPATAPVDGAGPAVGGIVTLREIPADQPFSVNATFQVAPAAQAARVPEDVVVQVFVTDEPLGAGGEGGGKNEIDWQFERGQGLAYLSQHSVSKEQRLAGPQVAVRLRVSREALLIDNDNKNLYRGEHQLARDKPRWVGVRFLRRGEPRDKTDKGDGIVLLSIGIDKP